MNLEIESLWRERRFKLVHMNFRIILKTLSEEVLNFVVSVVYCFKSDSGQVLVTNL